MEGSADIMFLFSITADMVVCRCKADEIPRRSPPQSELWGFAAFD